MLYSCKTVEKQSEAFHTFLWHFFPSLKHNFIAYRSSKVSLRPDCIFEIHQPWQSGFSRVYSHSLEPEIIKIGQSYHKMYSNNILNILESTTILNACTKKSGYLLKAPRMHNRSKYQYNLEFERFFLSTSFRTGKTIPVPFLSVYLSVSLFINTKCDSS